MPHWAITCTGLVQDSTGKIDMSAQGLCGIVKPGRYGTDPEENPMGGYCFRALSWEYHQLWGMGVTTVYILKDGVLFAKGTWSQIMHDSQRITPIRMGPPDVIYMVSMILPDALRVIN